MHAVLDEGYVRHLGFVRHDTPVVLSTLHARVGERLHVHSSTGSRAAARGGLGPEELPACPAVMHVDGLVLARSACQHSLDHRSVVVHGPARDVTDPSEREAALDTLVDQVVSGRSADVRRANAGELAATALDLEVSVKTRSGGPSGEAEDLAPGVPVPAYLSGNAV